MPDTTEFDTTGLTPIEEAATAPTDAQGLDASADQCVQASNSTTAVGLFDDLIPAANTVSSARTLPAPIPLPPIPREFTARARMRAECPAEVADALAELTTALRRAETWSDRAAILIREMTESGQEWAVRMSPRDIGLTVCAAVTLTLEALEEAEVGTIEQAAFYTISHHADWSVSASRWLEEAGPLTPAWIDPRPEFRRIAGCVRLVYPDIPVWLTGELEAPSTPAQGGR